MKNYNIQSAVIATDYVKMMRNLNGIILFVIWMISDCIMVSSKMAYMPKSKKQQHVTPDRVWSIISEMIGIPAIICKEEVFCDPCPVDTPYKAPIFFNGLYGDWEKRPRYVNCPFEAKTLRLFYKKSKEQSKDGNFTIMLLPSKTDQDWFHDIIKNGFRIEWIEGRLKFKGNKDNAMGGHFLVLIS